MRLDRDGIVTVETDMTDIGTGSYTIIAQTAAEMMGVPLEQVVVRLGDSSFPVSCGSGGQWGGNNSTAGVYAACMKLREAVAQKAGFNAADVVFAGGAGPLRRSQHAARAKPPASRVSWPKTSSSIGDLDKRYQQSTFGAHFVEVGVDAATGENARATHAGGVRLRPHPQSQDCAQPGDRRDDDGRWRRADGRARRGQALSASS